VSLYSMRIRQLSHMLSHTADGRWRFCWSLSAVSFEWYDVNVCYR